MAEMIYEGTYRVNTYETDASGSLSVQGLFNFLQDAASRHAEKLELGKDDLAAENMFWVLSRIYVSIYQMPGWEEEITIRTWPHGVKGIFALRDFEILGQDQKKIGAATSCWLIVDSENRRPLRPGKLLTEPDKLTNEKNPPERYPEKIPAIEKASYSSPVFMVKYSELDINMHANNVQYIKWVLDSYPLDFRLKNELESAEINYLSEALHSDEISVLTEQSAAYSFDHCVFRKNDNKELCRMRIVWKG